jgi:hypothetical protein
MRSGSVYADEMIAWKLGEASCGFGGGQGDNQGIIDFRRAFPGGASLRVERPPWSSVTSSTRSTPSMAAVEPSSLSD